VNLSHGLVNKLVYLAILILMLIPLFLLGQPESGTSERSGGQLTQMRDDFEISEADLGEINPASETMKLSSLGMRGVAASILWNKAHDHKVHHEWDRLRATLNNITLLQPHFEKVWEFQAHNMSYNVSTEFDDYRQRYAWVTGGTEYLTEGVRQNRKAPTLIWTTGWYYGQKLGMSDEKRQFRRLFAEDQPLHERIRAEGIDVDGNESLGPDRKPDNWLVGRQWLKRGYQLTREGGVPIRRKTPLHFYETGPKWLINHAVAIEEEGELSSAAQRAWQTASNGWINYGEETIPTTAEFTIRLGEIDELARRITEQQAEFDELTGAVRDEMRKERIQQLTDSQRALLDIPDEERTDEQRGEVTKLELLITPKPMEIAKRVPAKDKLKAIELAAAMNYTARRINKVDGYRQQVNYEYWGTRALAEQTSLMVEARRLVYEADRLNENAELDKAIEKYEEAWGKWAQIFENYPLLVFDASSDDLMDSLKRYRTAIDSEEFPDDFPLDEFVEKRMSGAYSPDEYEALREKQRKLNADQQRQQDLLNLDFRKMMSDAQGSVKAPEPTEAEEQAAEPDGAETPSESKPDGEMKQEESPAEESPAEESPAEESPAEESPAEESPAEEKPAEDSEAE